MIRASGVAPVLAAAGLLFAPRAAGPAPASYVDPTGDSGSAPDIAGIAITDDGASWGFAIDLATVQDLADGSVVAVTLNTDRSRATGDPSGADYAVFARADGATLDRWDGTHFSAFQHTATDFALTGGTLTFAVAKADVGSPSSFGFHVFSVHGIDEDTAPDGSAGFVWPGAPTILDLVVPSTPPRAGRVFALGSVRAQLSDGTTATPRLLSCTLTLAGRGLTRVGACSWRIPGKVKGRTVLLTVAVAVGARHSTRMFALRVR